MNKMRYISLFALLLTVDAFGMNNSNSNNQELSGSKRTYGEMADNNNNDDDNNVEFPINILMPALNDGESYVMPRNARGTATELLSLSDTEPLTLDSFRDLIEAKHNVKDSYILARVLTESGSFVQYFDANTLNRALFNQYPFGDLKELSQYRNPCSRLPIDKLDYYQCEPTKKTFEYWCSYADLSNADNPNGDRNIYRMMFYANQTANLAVAATAQVTLGLLKEESDLAEAMRLYTRAANQTDDLAVAARAQFNLALLKQKGEPEEAVRLYTRAASQNANLSVAAQAQNNLGCIYERALKYAKAKELFEKAAANKNALAKSNIALLYLLGHGVDKDLNEAVELLLSVANQTEDSYAAAFAQYSLGCIYLFKSEVRDYERAQAYLNQVINHTEHESAVAAAKNALAWMFLHGKGVLQDIEQAKKYYTEVSQQSNDNGQAVIAKISLKQIEALQKQEANV